MSIATKVFDHVRSAMRLATSLFLAGTAILVVIGGMWFATDQWQKFEARQYETPKLWAVDLHNNLHFNLKAKTKLSDSRLFMTISSDAYPPYLAHAREVKDTGLVINFIDKDGFKIHSKPIMLGSFMTNVDDSGKPISMSFEDNEYIDVDTYASISKLEVQWSFSTEVPQNTALSTPPQELLDHCAPNLAKAERLRRLGQHGTVRQTGPGVYETAGREVAFFTHDNSLLNCR
jgi:hypothetical protein